MKRLINAFVGADALRPEFAHMFQSYARGEKVRSPKLTVGCSHSSLHTNHLPCCCYARGEKERKGIESYLAISNRKSELRGISLQIFNPLMSALSLTQSLCGFFSLGGALESGALANGAPH